MPEFRDFFKSNYTGAWTLPDGKDLILTIHHVKNEEVIGEGGRKDTLPVCHFSEAGALPLVLNRTNFKSIVKLTGEKNSDAWGGRRVQLYCTTTKLKGDVVECVRIRPTEPQRQEDRSAPPAVCDECGQNVISAEIDGKRYAPALIVAQAKKKYGKTLCYECMKKKNAEFAAAHDAEKETEHEDHEA